MKYYVEEHADNYQRLQTEGKSTWDELFGGEGFDSASVLPFLEAAIPQLTFSKSQPLALEYGCGTGPGACYLATKGFSVAGIDLNPTAISLARKEAEKRGLAIRYQVGDVCRPLHLGQTYDLIVDSFCLQSIVTDGDRANLFRFVNKHLNRDGYYLIVTAGHNDAREYGANLCDANDGIVYRPLNGLPARYKDAEQISGNWYLPVRRHRTANSLMDELAAIGFRVVWQTVHINGDIGMICNLNL